MIRFEDLGAPAGVVAPAARADMFWEGMWRAAATTAWLTVPSVRKAVRAGAVRMPADMTPSSGERPLRSAGAAQRRCALLAAARMWGSLTLEQAATITGWPLATLMRDAKCLLRAGLIDVGAPEVVSVRGWSWRPTTLVAAGRVSDVRGHLADLTWPMRLSVTADRPWERASASGRHNALTTELCLRAATWLDVPFVAGEMLSGVDDLFGAGAGGPALSWTKRGDATIMRADGVRIVVETTASAAPSLGDKAEGWARLLAAHPGVGVIVLFLMAQPVDSSRTDLVHRVRRAVAAGVRAHPGAVGDPVSERMFVADWTGWFPEHGMVSEDFFALRALRWHPVRGWGPVDLLSLPCRGGSTAAVEASGLLAGVPWWLRRDRLDPMAPLTAPYGAGLERVGTRFGEVDYPELLRTPASAFAGRRLSRAEQRAAGRG